MTKPKVFNLPHSDRFDQKFNLEAPIYGFGRNEKEDVLTRTIDDTTYIHVRFDTEFRFFVGDKGAYTQLAEHLRQMADWFEEEMG